MSPDREIKVRYELIEAKTPLKTVSEKKEQVEVIIKRVLVSSFLNTFQRSKQRLTDRFISRYSPLSSRFTALMLHVILNEWLYLFTALSFHIHRSGVLTALFGCCMAGAACSCCRLGAYFVYTIQPCTSLQCHFIQRHIGRVHVCLAI